MLGGNRAKLSFFVSRENLLAGFFMLAIVGGWIFYSSMQTVPIVGAMPYDDKLAAAGREKVDLNTATVGSLRRLPGIGQSRALAIVAYRESVPPGCYKKLSDICKVKGIGVGIARPIARYVIHENDLANYTPAPKKRAKRKKRAKNPKSADGQKTKISGKS